MRLGDMLHILRIDCIITIRDKDNIGICTCMTNSKGVDPYINCEVTEWFPCVSSTTIAADMVVLIDLEDSNE